jgi:hypothetical protein
LGQSNAVASSSILSTTLACERRPDAAAQVFGGPDSTIGAYSSSCVRPSNVRLAIMSSAISR